MSKLQTITMNLSGTVRHDRMEGREYIVAPMVMAVEGVLNGSEGPLLYPANELGKRPGLWDHKPVVVYHPQINGQGVSACDPDMLTNHKVGVILNTQFTDGRLTAEAWIEKGRMDVVDPRVGEAIENNVMMELSTGLWVDSDKTPGEFGEKHYDAIATNLAPDHLALLPDKIGACSITDGAGFIRNEMGLEGLKEELQRLIRNMRDGDDFIWIVDVFSDRVVFEEKEKLLQNDYSATGDKVQLSGVPVEVIRRFEYVVVNSEKKIGKTLYEVKDKTMSKKETMDKKIVVNELIEAKKWHEDDREWLMSLNDDGLKHLQERKVPEPEPAPNETKEESEVNKTPAVEAPATNTAPKKVATPMTVNEFIAKAPPQLQEALQGMQQTHIACRTQLINKITANEQNTLTEDYLKTKSLDDLRAFASMCVNVEETDDVDYSGMASAASDHVEEALDLPTFNWGK